MWMICVLLTVLVACATTREKSSAPRPVQPDTQSAARSEAASHVVEITFRPGRAELTSEARHELTKLVTQARTEGEIDEVKVISWADAEYPSAEAHSLNRKQRQLADDRNRHIKSHLRELKRDLDIETYSMAERANALQRLLSTSDARIKRNLESAGIPTTDSDLKLRGKASRAVVLVNLAH